MKNKKLSVTVGIPAYNEEDNIQELLRALLLQRQNKTKLAEIIVVSDGSTDKTVEKVDQVRNKIIKLIINKKRQGQAMIQNVIVKKNKGDILVFLNADVQIKDKFFIEKLVTPILLNKKVGIVSPRVIPLPSQVLLESIINYSVCIKNKIYSSWRDGNNIFNCHGRARAFSKDFLKELQWKEVLSEDGYSYLLCIKKGYQFAYQPNTQVFYRSPVNFKDHQRQSSRFLNSVEELSKYFQRSFVEKEYNLPKKTVLKEFLLYFFKNPFLAGAYFTILSLVRILPYRNTNYIFEISSSSKRLK